MKYAKCSESGCKYKAVPSCQWCFEHCQKHWKDTGQHHPIKLGEAIDD